MGINQGLLATAITKSTI